MKRSRKSKGVSWAHGVNLCQVKLFSSEDCPSKVGQSSNHLQAKASGMLPPYTIESNDSPPGFNVTHPGNQLVDISCIALIKWTPPPKFVMSCHWRLAAGDESEEMESQKFREMRLLEAIYPRTSDIPPGANVSAEIENEPYSDSLTPLVPIIPIEEDECVVMESDSAAVGSFSSSSMQTMASNIQLEPQVLKSSIETSVVVGEKPPDKSPEVGVDVAAAASTALAVLMKSMEQGSMIDTNLLIMIFNDPLMIQSLTNILPLYEAASRIHPPSANAAPTSALLQPVTESISLPVPKSDLIQKLSFLPNGSVPNVSTGLPRVSSNIAAHDVTPSSGPGRLPASNSHKLKSPIPKVTVCGQENGAPVSSVRKEGQQLKDLNYYYKNLVRQHGGDQKESGREQKFELNGNNNNNHHKSKPENMTFQNQKRCAYFNSSKGCRNGDHCTFKHYNVSHNWRINDVLETHGAKRVKLWGEVAGRT